MLARVGLQPDVPPPRLRASRGRRRDGGVRVPGQPRHDVECRGRAADPGHRPGCGGVRQLRHHPGCDADPADARSLRDLVQRGRRCPQRPGAAAHRRGRVLVQSLRLRPDVLAPGSQRRPPLRRGHQRDRRVPGADPGTQVGGPDGRPVRSRHRGPASLRTARRLHRRVRRDRVPDRLLRREGLRDLPPRRHPARGEDVERRARSWSSGTSWRSSHPRTTAGSPPASSPGDRTWTPRRSPSR